MKKKFYYLGARHLGCITFFVLINVKICWHFDYNRINDYLWYYKPGISANFGDFNIYGQFK